MLGVQQHVYSSRMPVTESALLGGGNDSRQVRPRHGRVDIPGRPGLVWLAVKHMKERSHAADYAVRDSSSIEGGVKTPHPLKQLVHMYIVGARRQHSHS